MNPSTNFPKKYEVSYVFSDTMNRLFLLLKDMPNIEELNKKTQLPYIFTDRPTPLNFTYTFAETCSTEYSKKITWILNNKTIPCPISYTFTLIPNTLSNTTVLIFEILITDPEKIDSSKRNKIISGFKKVCIEMLNNIEVMLQVNHENIYDYGSIMIKTSIENVYNSLVSFSFLTDDIAKDIKRTGNLGEVGSTLSWTFIEGNEKCQSTLSYVSKGENKKKWKLKIRPTGQSFILQEISFVLVKVDEKKTFLSICHQFQEQVDIKLINDLSEKKKFLLSKIKKTCEKNL